MFLRGKHETRSFARVRGYDGRQRTERQREHQYHGIILPGTSQRNKLLSGQMQETSAVVLL